MILGTAVTSDWGRGWLRFNRIVLIRNLDDFNLSDAANLLLDIKGKTVVSKKPKLEEKWGFQIARGFSSEYSDALPNSIWGVWTKDRYIKKDKNRPQRRRVDLTWTLPGLILIRGERVEVDFVYEKLRKIICSLNENMKMETVSFDSLWFLWLFDVGSMRLSSSVNLKSVTGMHFLQDPDWSDHIGNEGKDLRERDAGNISQSMFSAVAILFGRRVEGFDGDFKIRLAGDNPIIEATLRSRRDDRIKSTDCDIAQKPNYRGSFQVSGRLADDEVIDESLMARSTVIGINLVKAYLEWRDKDAADRVPSDALVDKVKATIDTAMLDIDKSYERLRKWLKSLRDN
jgi:hypothetical protein